MVAQKLFLLFLLTQVTLTSTNLECFIDRVNTLQKAKSINFLQNIVNEGEKIDDINKIKDLEKRVLLSLNDENAKTDFNISKKNIDGVDTYIYFFTFDISKAKFLQLTYDDQKKEIPNFDPYWYNQVCLLALLDFPNLVQRVAEIFCQEATTPEVIGEFLDVRIGLYQYFFQGFRFVFQKFNGSYSKSAHYTFQFELTTESTFKQEELMDRIAENFEIKFAPERIKMMETINEYKTTLKGHFSKWILDIKNEKRWSVLDVNDKSKTGLKSYLGKAFQQLKEKEPVEELINNAKNNIYRVERKSELNYWMSYVNYGIRLYKLKSPLFFLNIQENLAIACLGVLKKLDFESMLTSKNNFDKCNLLAGNIFKYVKSKLPLEYLIFNSSTFRIFQDNIKVWMIEEYDSLKKNFYVMENEEFSNIFTAKYEEMVDKIIISKKKVILLGTKTYGKDYMSNIYQTAFFLKWDRFINADPDLFEYITTTISNKYGGIHNILNNMEVYLTFCGEIKKIADIGIQKLNLNALRVIFYDKFINRLSYALMVKFIEKKEIIKKIVPMIFEKDDYFYQDYYYYFDVVSIRFNESISQIDWDSADEDVVFITLKNKLQRIVNTLKIEIENITHFIRKNDEFNDIDIGKFRNLILNVMIKQRDSLHYFKSDVYNKNVTDHDEEILTKILNEYSQINSGANLKILELPKVKIADKINNKNVKIQTSTNILDQLFKMQGDTKNDKLNLEIKQYIKFVIDHYDYLPNEIKEAFIECTKNDADNNLEIQCIKTYGNPEKCRKLNPALISVPCVGYINGDDFNKCNLYCPKGFKNIKDRMCEKPEVYMIDENVEDCKEYFDNYEGVCIPKCPFGWKDMGVWCEKPTSILLEKHYHSGFFNKEDKI